MLLRRLCELTGTGRTWYSTHPAAEVVAARDVDLRDAIEELVLACPGYGYRRVTKALQHEGWNVDHKRVVRVMREESLLGRLQRHVVVTAQSDPGPTAYPNLLAAAQLTTRDQAWVADITSLHLPTTFVYLARLLDAWSRRCLGWQLSRRIDTAVPLAALDRARHLPAGGAIHPPLGARGAVRQRGVRGVSDRCRNATSMSAVGNPHDNAKAERFFRTLKREEVSLHHDDAVAEAETNFGHCIDEVENAKRLHSSLGYRPPIGFETRSDGQDRG